MNANTPVAPENVLAVDIGNTTIKAAIVTHSVNRTNRETGGTGRNAVCVTHLHTEPTKNWESAFSHIRDSVQDTSSLAAVAFCSVVEEVTRRAYELTFSSLPLIRIAVDTTLPFSVSYLEPRTLGADRVANALYAAYCYPKKDVFIVSAGTAFTVDFLRADGFFITGAIFPGITLQLQALAAKTSQLPHVPLVDQIDFPGNSTETCMLTGVVQSVVGGVERCIAGMQSLSGNKNVPVLLTGTSATLIARSVPFDTCIVSDMTFIGSAIHALRILSRW